MCITKHDATHPDSDFFVQKNPVPMVEILPVVPTAKFCASSMDNNSILNLGTLQGNQHFSQVPVWFNVRFLLVLAS